MYTPVLVSAGLRLALSPPPEEQSQSDAGNGHAQDDGEKDASWARVVCRWAFQQRLQNEKAPLSFEAGLSVTIN